MAVMIDLRGSSANMENLLRIRSGPANTLKETVHMKIKQGSNDYAQMVSNAMDATDQIFAISEEREKESKQTGKSKNNKGTQQGKNVKSNECEKENKSEKAITDNSNINEVFEIIEQFSHKSRDPANCNADMAKALLNALTGKNNQQGTQWRNEEEQQRDGIHAQGDTEQNKQLRKLSEQLIDHDHIGSQENTKEDRKKLISGKCAKPDDLDIKVVVKNAHKKLDSRHIKDKQFDALDFNILIAGQLELASLPEMSPEEHNMRICIAKTLCYHRMYLNDHDIREGVTILKQVEQGRATWNDNLAQRLHEHLDYRANVIMQRKIAESQEGFTKVEYKKGQEKKVK